MNISDKVRQLRKAKAWSQEQLATISGLSTKTIQRIESGSRTALESQQAIAAAFGVEIRELIKEIEPTGNRVNPYPKEYVLEIYFEGECIEQQIYVDPIIPPLPGEQFYITFKNKNYSDEHGNWWVVTKRKHLKFGERTNMESLMLFCTPDPKEGR